MVKIYALVSGQLILYVGKTIVSLKEREINHRVPSNKACSKYIPDYVDWTIKLLEEVSDIDSISKEQYYFDTLKPLYNRCRPGQTKKEYCQTDAYKERNRKRYIKKAERN